VQGSIQSLSCINIAIGLACLLFGSAAKPKFKMAALGLVVLVSIPFFLTPANAFVRIYSNRYPPPANKLLYCKENVNGTTTVFQDVQKTGQKYMLIDGTGEVSTDYFSMRAFRFLSILPALYSPQPKHALIVTFGTGIVAGAISNLPSIEHVDCIEICKQAFDASRNFSEQNHDVIHNPRINLIVNDGRNFVLTTKNHYDIISADATHPTSSDSWILYTKEFYTLCSTKLSDHGIMCQWIPLHGILENDYRVILATFHTAFPNVAVYYSGGYKTIGHTVLLGSKSPLKIDMKMANTLFADSLTRDDLAKVNVFNVYDFLNGFVLDQDAINEFRGEVPLNTDDKPCIIFSKFRLLDTPFMGLTPIIKYRKNVYDQLCNIDADSMAAIRETVDRNFQAMGYTIGGQLLEFKEYNVRAAQDFNKSKDDVVRNLLESKAIFEQIIENYKNAMQLNPADYHTKFLFNRVSSEFEYLNSFLESMTQPR
jgi:spermidine synthase